MKILITGGAGFIGANLTEKYLNEGHEVLVIDNFQTSKPENLLPHKNLQVVDETISNKIIVDALFEKFMPEIVVHAAASYKDPDNWQADINTNVNGTINIVQASKAAGVRRFVYFQTALCYGKPEENPISIRHPLKPFTSYSITKTAGENYVILSGLPFVSLRLANIYGPKHFSGPMPTFYKRLKNKQECKVVNTRRDFLDLSDLISLMDRVLNSNQTGCFNVSSGRDNSIKEIFDLMVDKMGIILDKPVEVLNPGTDDVQTLLLDPSLTEATFNWKARVSLEEGLANLINWYNEFGVEQAYTHLRLGKE